MPQTQLYLKYVEESIDALRRVTKSTMLLGDISTTLACGRV